MLTILALVVSGISVHLLNVLKQLGIATSVALAIGMVIGPSQVVARVAEFSIGRNLHPTWSARAGVLLCLIGLGLLISGLPWLALVAIALYGAGNGILTIARGTLPLALFGPPRIWQTNGTARKTDTFRPSLWPHRRSFRIKKLWGISNACSIVQPFIDVLHCQLALTVNARPKVEKV